MAKDISDLIKEQEQKDHNKRAYDAYHSEPLPDIWSKMPEPKIDHNERAWRAYHSWQG